MCVEVQISYPHCTHTHYGCELCPSFNASQRYCAQMQMQLRSEPFCPICSGPAYRASRAQPVGTVAVERELQPIHQIRCVIETGPPQLAKLRELLPTPHPVELGKQVVADDNGSPRKDAFSADGFRLPQLLNSNPYFPLPHPVEPPLHPSNFGPHRHREDLQKGAMAPTMEIHSFAPTVRGQSGSASQRHDHVK